MSLVNSVVFSVICFAAQQGEPLGAGEPAVTSVACAGGEDLVVRAAERSGFVRCAEGGLTGATLRTLVLCGAPLASGESVAGSAGGTETRRETRVTWDLARAVPPITQGEDEAAWEAVADGLRAVGAPAVERLVAEIGRGGTAQDAGLIWMLGRMGIEPGLALPPITEALSGTDEDLLRAAAAALAQFGLAGARALADAVAGGDEHRIAIVAEALAAAGRDAREAVPELVRALGHHDARIRRAVADGIARIGPDAGAAAPALAAALLDGDRSVRMAALWALASIGPDAAVAGPELRRLQEDPDAGVRGRSAVALARTGRMEDVHVAALVPGLDDAQADVRAMAAEASRRIGLHHPDLIPRLTAALEDPDPVVQWEAGAALLSI